MEFDFSRVNLEYLLKARDLASRDPALAATILGASCELAELLAELTGGDLTHIALIKPPLLILRQEAWWWSRLFKAIREERSKELADIIKHASLVTVPEDDP